MEFHSTRKMLDMLARTIFGLTAVADSSAVVGAVVGAGIGAITIGLLFAAALAVGFTVLVRRGRVARTAPKRDEIGRRANIALVRLDNEVASMRDELGFAVAQFGDERAATLAAALDSASANLASAFVLRRRLDDDVPDTPTQQREWNGQILMLCETASNRLAAQRAAFDSLRGSERDAPRDLEAVRERIVREQGRLPGAQELLSRLRSRYAPAAIAPVREIPDEAERLLDAARTSADSAAGNLDGTGATAVSVSIRSSEQHARRAAQLLDELERHSSALESASARLVSLIDEARSEVAAARAVRDSPPDPATGSAIAGAIAGVERTLAESTTNGAADPDAAIARIQATADALDTALAGARNQQQRLTHARAALDGALLTAQSQIDTTRAYMAGPRASAEARTRLAEAERLLALAEAESDPVIALDTARSSATYSRDADALARYDLL